MKESFAIIGAAFSSLRQYSGVLAFNALPFFLLLVVIDIAYPTYLVVFDSGAGSDNMIQQLSAYVTNNFIKIIPTAVSFAVYLVFAHRNVLQAPESSKTPITLRVSKVELRFLIYATAIGILYTAALFPVAIIIGRMPLGLVDSGFNPELLPYFSIIGAYAGVVAGGLVTYRFALVPPLVVVGADKPLRQAWAMTRDRNIFIISILAILFLIQDLSWRVARFIGDIAPLTVFDLNLTWAALWNVANLFVAALGALTLSQAYLRLRARDQSNNGETTT